MQNARVDESQAGIKIARRNSNSLRYTDDSSLMAESEEELKSLLMKVKEESEKAGLKLNFQKMSIMASGCTTSWQVDGENVETVTDFIFLVFKISAEGDCSHKITRFLLLGSIAMTNLDSVFGEGNANPLQCSCLENPRDRGARWAAIYGVAQSRT